ncbi:MAG: amidohydrolase [Oscillospiraceae bacterium]|jgi:amidohydrolase|nr:amidohydrolase [Oscillospiraceae bacterium]
MAINALSAAKENSELTIELRRHIHRHPELSGAEFETLKYIRKHLDEYGVDYVEVEDGGILGFLGDETKGRTLLLRADIDALPILENKRNLKREKTVVSENDGVHHACGHDAHTSILLTAGKILKEHEAELNGRVILFFERGEEGTGNIRQLMKYIERENIHVDASHAIHVAPQFPAGKLIVQSGAFFAGAYGFNVTITGQDGHGSRPDLSNNPIDCFVAVYNAISTIRLRKISPYDTLTFSVGQLTAGTRGNIIPQDLTFSGSARLYSEEAGEKFGAEFTKILDGITAAYGCTYTNAAFLGAPLINNAKIAELIQNSVKSAIGEDALVTNAEPWMGSESFSLLTKLYPGTMISLGLDNEELGSGAQIHNEYFDIDEDILHVGVAETAAFAVDFLNYKGDIPFTPYDGTISDLLGGMPSPPTAKK